MRLDPNSPKGSFVTQKVVRLKALYDKFGIDGLKDASASDMRMLLAAKRMELQEVGREEMDRPLAQQLQLEILDLSDCLKEKAREWEMDR